MYSIYSNNHKQKKTKQLTLKTFYPIPLKYTIKFLLQKSKAQTFKPVDKPELPCLSVLLSINFRKMKGFLSVGQESEYSRKASLIASKCCSF